MPHRRDRHPRTSTRAHRRSTRTVGTRLNINPWVVVGGLDRFYR
jgi:hypothetical protein